MKKKIISAVVGTLALCMPLAILTFAGNANFYLHPTVSSGSVSTDREKKDDSYSAVVNLKTGLSNDYVTFRVRTSAGTMATDYKDVSGYGKTYYSYWSGHGYVGNYYKLYASYDSGQSRNGAYVTGTWAP